MINLADRVVAFFAPVAAVKRAQARKVLSYYEAAKPDRNNKGRRERGTADSAVMTAGLSLREQARHLEQNHDIAKGIINTLVQNVVGANGIGVEPMPRRMDGTIHEQFAIQLLALYLDWCKRPEVTWQHNWASAQRLMARTWVRDGEVLAQMLSGPVVTLDHGTRVPFSIEMIEPDLLPMDYTDLSKKIVMGVERNGWGRPVAYHLYREYPNGLNYITRATDVKRVPAARIRHLKLVDRIWQARGVTVFAPVLKRLDDIKDYEESERVAAKVAASMAAYIIKGDPELYNPDGTGEKRQLKFRPGMIFDDLRLGESIGTIDTNRPNTNLENFRRGQIRAASTATFVTYSSASKDYDGTYSAQRQELVEGWGAYAVLGAEFSSQMVQPIWEQFIDVALLAGLLDMPADLNTDSLKDALFIGPQMPWIDPVKEANAWEILESNAHASGPEIIRRRGRNPRDVLEEEANWRRLADEKGVSLSANHADSGQNAGDTDEQDAAQPGARTRGGRARG